VIRQFKSDDYWEWGRKELGIKHAKRVNKLRAPITEGTATRRQVNEFYDYIAHTDVSGVVHSMKAHAIASSLWAVDRLLPASGRILDLGCSIGVAAIYYCVRSPDRHLVGCDISAKSIVRARTEAARRRIQNIAFELADIQEGLPNGIFDAVVSSQVLGGIPDRSQALRRVAESLSDDGVLISIEPIGTVKEAAAYVSEAEEHGLRLHGFRMLGFEDVGQRQAYPQFLLRRSLPAEPVDMSGPYLAAFAWTDQ
jgi:2-polyprenyl-3-methyl-5-hydroxy-6-metoxy-1,4-benzoquinol methylase